MSFSKFSEIIDLSERKNIPFWQVIINDDMRERAVSSENSFEKMRSMYHNMRQADESYNPLLRSRSGLVGGDGQKLAEYRKNNESLAGDFIAMVMEKAVKMAESNACMRRIVAAPTAGSCGVIPAVLLSYEEMKNVSEEKMVQALFVAAGVGEVIAESACISGAQGGCQAEIGSASAMSAAALAYLEGCDNDGIINASALAIKNMLGLTCDPVAGLVEVPCVKRNIAGAVNAVVCCEEVKAGLRSRIPPDEIVDAMRRTGNLICGSLRETGEEGLATTDTGIAVKKQI